jgi:hypothetical protein
MITVEQNAHRSQLLQNDTLALIANKNQKRFR